MAAPTYGWNTVNTTQTDADSPLDTTLMEAIRQNLVHLEEWLGDGYTAAKDHDHDGVNSKTAVLADDSVSAAKLARTGEVSLFDDFIGEVLDGELADIIAGKSTVTVLTGQDNGVVSCVSTDGGYYGGIGQQTTLPWRLASGVTITFETRAKSAAGTPRLSAGLWDGGAHSAAVDDMIEFDRNSGTSKLQVHTRAGGVSTQTDLDVDFSTSSFQVLKFVATPSQVDFYVDGVLKASHTTNIPGTSINMGIILAVPSITYTTHYDYGFCHQDARN